MFRNNYLDTYKHAVLSNKQVQFLFLHLSQLYTTMGSVINDIQYQFGLILAGQKNQTAHQNNLHDDEFMVLPSRVSAKQAYVSDFKNNQNKQKQKIRIEENIQNSNQNNRQIRRDYSQGDFIQMKNKLDNYAIKNAQKMNVPELRYSQNLNSSTKQQNSNKGNIRIVQNLVQNKPNLKDLNSGIKPVVQSTQDFDSLFFPKDIRQQYQNSNSRQRKPSNTASNILPPQFNNPKTQFNNPDDTSKSKRIYNQQNQKKSKNDFLDKLFG